MFSVRCLTFKFASILNALLPERIERRQKINFVFGAYDLTDEFLRAGGSTSQRLCILFKRNNSNKLKRVEKVGRSLQLLENTRMAKQFARAVDACSVGRTARFSCPWLHKYAKLYAKKNFVT